MKHDKVQNIFDAWPRAQADVLSGDYVYWKDMPSRVARYALDLPIWPIWGLDTPCYERIGSLLTAGSSTQDNVLGALVRTGLKITQPPCYLTQIIHNNYSNYVKMLSPEIVHEKLQVRVYFHFRVTLD